jgi:hypothetical protein
MPVISNCKNNFNHLPFPEAVKARVSCHRFEYIESNEWKTIPGHPDYKVNSSGSVKHLKSYGGKPRVLVPTLCNNLYFYITLTVNGKRKGFPVDRLVVMAFYSIPVKNIRKVIHLDGIKFNNQFSNLSYTSF